ncbi:hypothetical protein COCON_G00143160 [Conger conger]|uniref:Uncharacterized protein n=1 Tax=Conger conger TaxID=82655 RepID=A0A9Q1HU52_CONCO|nr:hypothetical protein COCON_G00143160 [Conger conger]
MGKERAPTGRLPVPPQLSWPQCTLLWRATPCARAELVNDSLQQELKTQLQLLTANAQCSRGEDHGTCRKSHTTVLKTQAQSTKECGGSTITSLAAVPQMLAERRFLSPLPSSSGSCASGIAAKAQSRALSLTALKATHTTAQAPASAPHATSFNAVTVGRNSVCS